MLEWYCPCSYTGLRRDERLPQMHMIDDRMLVARYHLKLFVLMLCMLCWFTVAFCCNDSLLRWTKTYCRQGRTQGVSEFPGTPHGLARTRGLRAPCTHAYGACHTHALPLETPFERINYNIHHLWRILARVWQLERTEPGRILARVWQLYRTHRDRTDPS